MKSKALYPIIHEYRGKQITEWAYTDKPSEFETNEPVPVIGVLTTGHKTLRDAKDYLDKTLPRFDQSIFW
jgi:hypothetical protein